MKILLFGLVVAFGVSSCSKDVIAKNENTKQDEDACASLANFAQKAMKYHQSNILMDTVFKEIDTMTEVPAESKDLLKNIVVDAYKQPVFTDQAFRDRQAVDFANDTHLKCLKIME